MFSPLASVAPRVARRGAVRWRKSRSLAEPALRSASDVGLGMTKRFELGSWPDLRSLFRERIGDDGALARIRGELRFALWDGTEHDAGFAEVLVRDALHIVGSHSLRLRVTDAPRMRGIVEERLVDGKLDHLAVVRLQILEEATLLAGLHPLQFIGRGTFPLDLIDE